MIPIIDVGHGGLINGAYQTASGKKYRFNDGLEIQEGVINRAIGKKLISYLDSEESPFEGDPWVEENELLRVRSSRVNKICRILTNSYLISLHSNSASKLVEGNGNTAKGFEIFIHDKASKRSVEIAETAAEVYQARLGQFKFRGIKKANFHMLRETDCPAILVENLFFDNREEAEFLLSSKGQWDIARVLFEIVKKLY